MLKVMLNGFAFYKNKKISSYNQLYLLQKQIIDTEEYWIGESEYREIM